MWSKLGCGYDSVNDFGKEGLVSSVQNQSIRGGSWVDVSPWLTRVMNCDEKVVEIGFIVNRKRLKLAAQTTLLAPSVLPEHP